MEKNLQKATFKEWIIWTLTQKYMYQHILILWLLLYVTFSCYRILYQIYYGIISYITPNSTKFNWNVNTCVTMTPLTCCLFFSRRSLLLACLWTCTGKHSWRWEHQQTAVLAAIEAATANSLQLIPQTDRERERSDHSPSSSDTSRISSTVSGKLMRCFSVVICREARGWTGWQNEREKGREWKKKR